MGDVDLAVVSEGAEEEVIVRGHSIALLLPDGRVLTAGSNPEPRHLESHGGERGHPRACGRSTGPSLAAECSTGSRAVKECFRPLPILVDSTRRNLLIRWQKRAAAWEHGFESRSEISVVESIKRLHTRDDQWRIPDNRRTARGKDQ